ncbi:hypothetical protein N657DRAFT_348234 [Parathielavia appendiculata]|uniref:Uncharacterized protein n=1 Tax=Parathielavia appendiculata TaxID=2587402 RepID=A0AAN6Z5K4_9PEZI|nr:hypothetical protein N657DRAFT_348234 [Parathielavia appendiculata]
MFQRTLQRLKQSQPFDGFPANFETLPFMRGQPTSSAPSAGTPKWQLQDEFTLSEKVIKFAKDSDIAFPNAPRLVPGQKFDKFPIRFFLCPRHAFSWHHTKFLSEFEHPLTDKILHHYTQEKRTRPLWCYVQGTSTHDGSKVVVRNTSERVVKAALFQALNSIGYDSFGKSLDGTKSDLRGTIRIAVSQPKAILKVDFERLRDYLAKLVADAIPRLQGGFAPKRSRGP